MKVTRMVRYGSQISCLQGTATRRPNSPLDLDRELGRYSRVITLEDGKIIHHAFLTEASNCPDSEARILFGYRHALHPVEG